MVAELLAKYDQRVPRYTSYPTAPHLTASVGAAAYRHWLAELDPELPLSLYIHVPFCDSLCWFCGCHTKIVLRYEPVARYLDLLRREIALVAEVLGPKRKVCHVHFGGGTPTILDPEDFRALFEDLRARFDVLPDADIAVENDPRELNQDIIRVMAEVGVNRASLGLQDINPEVQQAVNRVQSLDETRSVADALRAAGIPSLNVDLMYGLPHQTVPRLLATIAAVRELAPERVCIFGYAHVPWMKRHQRLIDEAALPGPVDRFAQYMAAAEALQADGYDWIGLDHFAVPQDELAVAARERRLHRNFQGYTTDDAPVRLGFGASAIGTLPQGFIQNAVPTNLYRDAVKMGELPVAKGLRLSDDDRLRGAVIEQLMCYLDVDLDAVCADFGCDPIVFSDELAGLDEMEADGLVQRDGARIRVTKKGRPFVRAVCARFDRYLNPQETRHVRAV